MFLGTACWRGVSCNDHIHLNKRRRRQCEFPSCYNREEPKSRDPRRAGFIWNHAWSSRKTRSVGTAAPAGNGCPIDGTTAAARFPACITGSGYDLVSGVRGPPSVTAVAEELITGRVFRSAPSHTHTLSPTLETQTHFGHFIHENIGWFCFSCAPNREGNVSEPSVPAGANWTPSLWGSKLAPLRWGS